MSLRRVLKLEQGSVNLSSAFADLGLDIPDEVIFYIQGDRIVVLVKELKAALAAKIPTEEREGSTDDTDPLPADQGRGLLRECA